MNKSKYIIDQNLIEVMFNKVTKDEEKYGKSLVFLTNEELEKKIKEFQSQGFIVNTYHQEEFDDGWRFIKDGTGLDDITEYMSKFEMNDLLYLCKEEIENICKREIQNGNIDMIVSGNYPFKTDKRVYNILYKYAKRYGENIENIIFMDLPITLISYIGNVEQTLEVIKRLGEQNIYIDFYKHGYCTSMLFATTSLEDEEDYSEYKDDFENPESYLMDDLIGWFSEFYIEDLLSTMLAEGKISEELYEKYA